MYTGLSLSGFKSKVSDFARPNRFEVIINPPKIYNDFKKEELQLLSWLAETAQLPSRTQGEAVMKYHGMELKLPGDYTKENITIGFLNSYGFEGRLFFERWMENHIQNTNTTNTRQSSIQLIDDCSIIVRQLGRVAIDSLADYTFYNVFPTTISNIDLSMDSENQIEKFTVSFSYSHYSLTNTPKGKNG